MESQNIKSITSYKRKNDVNKKSLSFKTVYAYTPTLKNKAYDTRREKGSSRHWVSIKPLQLKANGKLNVEDKAKIIVIAKNNRRRKAMRLREVKRHEI